MNKIVIWFMTKVLKRKKTKIYSAEHYVKDDVEVWEIDMKDYKNKYI